VRDLETEVRRRAACGVEDTERGTEGNGGERNRRDTGLSKKGGQEKSLNSAQGGGSCVATANVEGRVMGVDSATQTAVEEGKQKYKTQGAGGGGKKS